MVCYSQDLLGILARFRLHYVAISTDIEKFSVQPAHRNYLRFFWHHEKEFNQDLIAYRMKRYVFRIVHRQLMRLLVCANLWKKQTLM